jgi:hypothetical protein
VIRALAWKARQNQPLSEDGNKLLLGIAAKATEEEALNLLDLVGWCSEANLPLGIQILETLPDSTSCIQDAGTGVSGFGSLPRT